ncbi:protein winged eye isoform X4 [Culex quinquefasciatus]|nr:protein winged eye isoform X4 [Culex quinquefasciatus]XP_038117855.1 protein winged eye isoform X4 [Culex quinquefasciatus]
MLGPTANGRLVGPGIVGSSAGTLSQQQQQQQHNHRNLWPPVPTSAASRAFEFQTNGEVTESLFAAGGYNTPPASSPFLPCTPLELVAKNFHSAGAAVTFSQANSSIFVQSQTDFINGTTSVAKKTETCIGRWEHGTLEPLQIQVPPVPSVTNLDIKTEHNGPDSQITYASSNLNTHTNTSYESDGLDQRYHYYQQQQHHHQLEQQPPILTSTSARNTSLLARQHRRRHRLRYSLEDDSSSSSSNCNTNTLDQVLTPTTTTNTVTTASLHSFSLIPIIPEQQQQQPQQSRRPADCSVIVTAPPRNSQRTPWVEQLHIKREPCQVSEVTTSNNFETSSSSSTALTAVVKLEAQSPKGQQLHQQQTMDHIGITTSQQQQQQNNAIPVGIAVARQRLQESTTAAASQLHQAKELNRFGIGLTGTGADLGCTTPSLAQNMFFAGTNSTMIPLTAAASDAVTMGVTNAAAVQNAVRTPPALWQYPGCQQQQPSNQAADKKVVGYLVIDRVVPPADEVAKKAPIPMESMLPMPPMPPVGFQLVRDPGSGQILFLPAATTIANPTNLLDKIFISCVEPFQQTVLWPSYPQSTAIQPPHLLLPQIAQQQPQQQLQPPPLAPLQVLSSDYLATASSTTLHQLTGDSQCNGLDKNPLKLISPFPASIQQQQHTQTHHSTRYLALASDGCGNNSANIKRTTLNTSSKQMQLNSLPAPAPIQPSIPMPIPSHTFIKIEDCSGPTTSNCHNPVQQLFHEPEKTIQTATIATSPDIAPQLLFQQGNLIQIAPSKPTTILDHTALLPTMANPITPPPSTVPAPIVPSPHLLQQQEIPAATCLTPPPDQSIAAPVESSEASVPEVQDANVQTDTPVMSEDDNTVGTDDVPQQHDSATLTTEESHFQECFPQQQQSCETLCHTSIINSSADSAIEPDMSVGHSSINTSTSTNCDQVDMEVEDGAISSTAVPVVEHPKALTVNANCGGLRIPKLEMLSPTENPPPLEEPRPEQPPQQEHPVDLSGLELLSRSIEVFQKKASMIKKEPISPQLPPEPLPIPPLVPCEPVVSQPEPVNSPAPTPALPTPETFIRSDEPMVGLNLLCALAEQRFQEEGMFKKDSPAMSPAEQQDPPPATPSPTVEDEVPSSRKRKHKHSKESRKSSKKSKHDREQRRDRKRKHSSEEDEFGGELKESYRRIKTKLEKCSCKDADERDHRCCGVWPSANELFNVMESDMKQRLVSITRQCEEKKRELEQMACTSVAKVKPMTAMVRIPDIGKSYLNGAFGTTSTTLSAPKFSTIPALSPSFSSSSNSTSFVELPKLSSDTDSSKLEDADSSSIERLSFSKRKGGVPKKHDDIALTETIVAKKPKSLVGYILASKNRVGDSNVKETSQQKASSSHHGNGFADQLKKKSPIHSSKFESTTSDDTSNLSDSSAKQLKIKSPPFSFDDENSKPSDAAFSIFGGKPSIFDKIKSATAAASLPTLPLAPNPSASKHHSSSKSHKKSRSSKERKRRRSSEKRRIDQRCMLTSEHLNQEKTRVLFALGGLFYAGCLSAVQPPDIYAVTLDGERGNRPHIESREEVLRDAILEVAPKSVDEIPPGTRLCAYWSQQYRCLYPGVAAEPTSPDPEKRYVNVEFDDGDSGRIALEDIRYLLSDYPIVEYDPNPLLSLGKRKRQPSVSEVGSTTVTTTTTSSSAAAAAAGSTATTSTTITTTNCFAIISSERTSEKRVHDDAYREERRRLKKIRKDKLRRLAATNAEVPAASAGHKSHKKKSKCYDELCKHRKHKKRRKHKKHHRESHQQDIPSSPDGDAVDDDISQGDSASQTAAEAPFSPASTTTTTDKLDEPEFNPSLKEDTMTEEEAESSITESSGSYYQPAKKSGGAEKLEKRQSTENGNSKIAAFLPARQLWAWCGKGYRRSTGRVKKQFYKSIQRGKETISVGDSAVFLSTGRPDRPYIGHIESMWETSTNNMVVRVKWFYHPEEAEGCPNLKYPGALFQSPHEDENDVQTISHKCEVLALKEYTAKFGADPRQYSAIYDNNDTYYLAGYYDPTVVTIRMQPDIEVLPGGERWVKTD